MRSHHGATTFDPPAGIDDDQMTAFEQFQRALAIGNPRLVRSAAAELPYIGIAEAAAILLVIERTEPENYERTALHWLAQLATEGRDVSLHDVAHAAMALDALPRQPMAHAILAGVCRRAGLPEAASVFAASHRRPAPARDR